MISHLSGGGVEESNSSQQQPWLIINDRQNCCIQNNMFNNSSLLYDVGGEIPEFLGRHLASSFGEWVLLVGTGTGDCLVNLVSKERIELPSLYFKYYFCVLTSHPYDPTCHIVYFHRQENAFVFCQPGDKEFTIRKWDYEFFPLPRLAVVAGKIFLALDEPNNLFSIAMIEFKESTYQLEVLQMAQELLPKYFVVSSFFEYSGELFKVCKILTGSFSSTVNGFEIFKADLVRKKWVSVKNIGRVAIFIGYTGDQVKCVESAANSIYFLEADDLHNYYIYSLEEGTIRMKPTFLSSMEMETTKLNYTKPGWIMMHSDPSFPKLSKGDQESICQDSEKETKAIGEVEEVVGVQNSWNMLLPELLNLIQLHLFGRDRAVFRVACEAWQQVSIQYHSIPSIPSLLSWTALLELCQSFSTPLLMFQEDMTISDDSVPIFKFVDPVHRKSYRTGVPELRGTEIHYSRDGWLLVSRRSDRSIFFLNPLTQEKIELPRNRHYHRFGFPDSFSFSSPPTCSNCLVVGLDKFGKYMFTLKHGEKTWKRDLFGVQIESMRHHGYCPVVLNGLHHFMCENRDTVVFNLKDGVEGRSPYCQTKFKRPDDLREEDFFLEIDGALAFVCVKPDGGEISIFKWNDLEADWELMEGGVDFGGKEMFLSKRGSLMEKIDDVGGMGNTIFLPMVDDEKEGVFYSLATHKYHTFYSGYSSELPYNVDKFLNGIWVKPDRKIVGDNNLKWFM